MNYQEVGRNDVITSIKVCVSIWWWLVGDCAQHYSFCIPIIAGICQTTHDLDLPIIGGGDLRLDGVVSLNVTDFLRPQWHIISIYC